ncbi:hypothetical protein ACWESM_04420 [Nocardia sp. NPDC003999]
MSGNTLRSLHLQCRRRPVFFLDALANRVHGAVLRNLLGPKNRYNEDDQRQADCGSEPDDDPSVRAHPGYRLHASDVHQPQNSVPLAERALLSARGKVSPDTMALFEVALARCYAETGDKVQAVKALRRVEPWIMPEATTEIPRWAALFCPNKASATRQTAKTFLAIGDLAEAERYQHMSATIWHPRTHTRIHAISLAETGLIRWRMGNHEDAAKLWRTALPTLTSISSERGSKLLRRIRRAAPELVDHT